MKALTTPAAENKRFVVGNPISHQKIVDTLRGMPELEGRLPKDSGETPTPAQMVTGPANEALSIHYRTMKETFWDEAKKILQWEKELGVH